MNAGPFDRRLLRLRRDRAADGMAAHGFLFREVAARLTERLDDIKRRFPVALDLGCHTGDVARALVSRSEVGTLVQSDLSSAMAQQAGGPSGLALAADEEALPFASASFDLVLSSLSLHWVNDLPGALFQIRQILKPDGLFLAAMLGGGTLAELRTSFVEAELAEQGGAGSHVAPFADVRDAGNLLQRAGFALPVADAETITVTYPDVFALMRDLRGMGETNAGSMHTPLHRDSLNRAAEIYRSNYADNDGRIRASFEIIYLTAWAPHESQPKALKPGTAVSRLAEALGSEEKKAGDKARP